MAKVTKNHDFLEFLNQTYGTKDTDGDGICDEVELMIGTDPLKADTDGDGMSDAEEIRVGRNPLGPGDFRDFFIPHERNGFRPHAVHPKRLLFYVTSATAIKVLVVMFVVSFPLTAWFSPDVMNRESEKIVYLTNELRQKHELTPLVESSGLKTAAYEKAEDMLLQQYFAHDGPDNKSVRDWLARAKYQYEVAGENLAMGFAQSDDVVEAWIKSPTHYANLIDPEYSEIGVGMVSGAFKGEETTLVAQYFGRPKQVAEVRAQATPVPQLSVKKEVVVAQGTDQSHNQVVVQVESPATVNQKLEKIVIIKPSSGLVTSDKKVTVVVQAPGVAKLILKNNNLVLAELDKIKNDEYGSTELVLEDGEYNIVAEAVSGEIVKQSELVKVVVDSTAPEVIIESSKLYLESMADSTNKLLRVEAMIKGDATETQVLFADHYISLHEEADGMWSGQSVIYNFETDNFKTLVPAVLTTADALGNKKSFNLPLTDVVPTKGSWTEKYFFLKNNPNSAITKIFDVSTIFYRILLIATGLVLFAVVAVGKKKRHKHAVLYTVAFAIFIIFLLLV